jgi:predicted nucleotide-binding protein
VRSHIRCIRILCDEVVSASASDDEKRRARQNVILEMGYFLGILGRESGRVLFLYKGPIEIPSDTSGVEYIDITQGIKSAGEDIRRELRGLGTV